VLSADSEAEKIGRVGLAFIEILGHFGSVVEFVGNCFVLGFLDLVLLLLLGGVWVGDSTRVFGVRLVDLVKGSFVGGCHFGGVGF